MSFQIGDIVGSYRVTGLLGSGGAGHVYRVEHTITGQIEAMKVLLESGSADRAEQAERFLREIQVQARLQHPNVAAVHNAFWVGDRLVMVMEFVEGESLDERLARGRIPLDEGVGYMQQVLSALSYAHARDVIHRDIKPANLIIARQDGAIKVMDFGLARGGNDPKLTQTGAVAGSLYYISPEQVRALSNVDARADIYSLGAIFYEVATGRKPFPCDQAFELMSAHVHKLPDPPIEVDPSVPQTLNDAILRAMAKDPAARFASADEFLEATRQVSAAPEPVEGRERPQEAAVPRTRSWPRLAVALALVAVILALFSAVLLKRQRAQQVSEATASGEFELLRSLRVDGGLTAAAFSPDNRWVAVGTGNRQIKIWNARTAQEYASFTGHEGAITALAFSTDGNRLASGSADKTVRLWDLATRQPSATLRHSAGVVSLAFAEDGGRLAAGTSDRTIHLWDTNTGESLFTLSAQVEPLLLAFASGTERLATAGPQPQVQLWDLAQSTTASQLLDVGSGIVGLRFGNDGSLATLSSGGLQEWDLASLRERRSTPAPPGVSTFAYTPRGDCMTLAVQGGTVAAHDLAAAQNVALLQHGQPITGALLNSDGLKAATYSKNGDFWLWQATARLEAQGAPDLVVEEAKPVFDEQVAEEATPKPSAPVVAKGKTKPSASVSTAEGAKSTSAAQIVEEAKPTPFPKVQEEAPVKSEKSEPEPPVRDDERDPKKRKGVFRRFLGIFR